MAERQIQKAQTQKGGVSSSPPKLGGAGGGIVYSKLMLPHLTSPNLGEELRK